MVVLYSFFVGMEPPCCSMSFTKKFLIFAPTILLSTKSIYRTHQVFYLKFCNFMGLTAIPASSQTVGLYAVFLARSLKFNSIKSYLNIIGVLHKEFGLPNPISDNWHFKSLLIDIKQVKGSTIKQTLPTTVDILYQIYGLLNCDISFDPSFWTACSVAFLAYLGNHTSCLLPQLSSILNYNSLKALSNSAHGVHSSMLSEAKLSTSGTESFSFPYHTLLVHLFVLLHSYL